QHLGVAPQTLWPAGEAAARERLLRLLQPVARQKRRPARAQERGLGAALGAARALEVVEKARHWTRRMRSTKASGFSNPYRRSSLCSLPEASTNTSVGSPITSKR